MGCALALIGLDYAFFQIKCLTALEGVSPRIEARIGWCFDKSTNFFALLIGYSRLHIVLSAFLIPGFMTFLAPAENRLDLSVPLSLPEHHCYQSAYYEQRLPLRILPYTALDSFVRSRDRRVYKASHSGMATISCTESARVRMDRRRRLLLESLAYAQLL